MVSPELLRRYTFFGGLSMEHIVILAQHASEMTIDQGQFFFHEEDTLDAAYILVEGEVSILTELPEKKMEIVTGVIKPGEMFGWSALLPPYLATASARASKPCRVIAFNCQVLRALFEEDAPFAFVLTQRIAQVIRERLQSLRIESLAYATMNNAG